MTRALDIAKEEHLDDHYVGKVAAFAASFDRRSGLDLRTRSLVLVGQFTVSRSQARLEDALRRALAEGLAREALEVILQCTVYAGDTAVAPALATFVTVAQDLGVLDGLRGAGVPREGIGDRDLEAESRTWDPADLSDPRRERLMAKYGWRGVSTGLRLRPRHHLDILEYLDSVDDDFARHWLDFIYDGLYGRGVLDDRTRLLCLVGELSALGETTQLREHMRGALRSGATVAELKEVVLQTCVNFGMPVMLRSLALLVGILDEAGRLAEIGSPRRVAQ